MWFYFSFVLFYFYTVRASELLGNDLEYSENVENGQKVNFTGYRLVQATPQTSENLKLLKELDQQIEDGVLDFWSEPFANGKMVEMLVHPEMVKDVQQLFTREKIPFKVTVSDIQKLIDDESEELKNKTMEMEEIQTTFFSPNDRYRIDFETYNTLDKIMAYIDSVATSTSKYTDKKVDASITNLGTTYEGRTMKMLKLAVQDSITRPAILMDCGIHAREWVSPAFCLHAIRMLLKDGSFGLLNKYDFNIIPVANPDGYVYTQTNRMWRKNREPSSFRKRKQFGGGWGQPGGQQLGFGQQWGQLFGSGSGQQIQMGSSRPLQQAAASKCIGVDPNRNFDIGHGTVGSSNNRCQDTYHGTGPFSSAEARALKVAVENIKATQKLASYVSVHAYSQMWMTPHGYTKQLPPNNDYQDQMRVARKAVSALAARHGTKYEYGPIAKVIYEAAGSSVDWAYAKAGIKYCWALELRPGRHGSSGFMLPTSQIKPTVEETWDGITAMAEAIYPEFQQAGGGDYEDQFITIG